MVVVVWETERDSMFLFFLFFLAALAIVFLFGMIMFCCSSLIGGCSASINLVLDVKEDDEDEMVFEDEEEEEVLLTAVAEELSEL